MKLLVTNLLLLIMTLPSMATTLLLPDFSYICFSHSAVFSDKTTMIHTLKCVNTVGQEPIEQLIYHEDGTWSAILYSYHEKIEIFGSTSQLRPVI